MPRLAAVINATFAVATFSVVMPLSFALFSGGGLGPGDLDQRAAHEGRFIGSQEGHERRNFLRATDAAERNELVEIGNGAARTFHARLEHRRVNLARADRVDAYLV